MAEAPSEDITEDTLLGGRVRLRQPRRGHRIGTDAVLLAAAVDPRPGEIVFDMGAGVGGVGLIVGLRSQGRITFVERDALAAQLCRANIALNGLHDRAAVIEADILAPGAVRRAAGFLRETADLVVTNPPFLDEGRARASPSSRRATAHHLPQEGLEQWISTCAEVLRPKGRFAMIHRADRLDLCLRLLDRRFGALRVRPIYPRAGEAAIRILIIARKGSRTPLTLLPPLVLHGPDGGFTPEADAVHRGERLLCA